MPVDFETLKQLAREPSPERRRELVQAIATAFFAAPQRTANRDVINCPLLRSLLAWDVGQIRS